MSEVKLPEFKVLVGDNETIVRLNGKKIGAAWGPSADGSGAWFAYRYGEDPARFADEATAKRHLLGLMNMPLPDWATNPAPVAAPPTVFESLTRKLADAMAELEAFMEGEHREKCGGNGNLEDWGFATCRDRVCTGYRERLKELEGTDV